MKGKASFQPLRSKVMPLTLQKKYSQMIIGFDLREKAMCFFILENG